MSYLRFALRASSVNKKKKKMRGLTSIPVPADSLEIVGGWLAVQREGIFPAVCIAQPNHWLHSHYGQIIRLRRVAVG